MPPPSQNDLEGIIKAKAIVLLEREREIQGLRQAHSRTAAWLRAFHALRPEHGCAGAHELCAEWAEWLVRDLHFETAAVYRQQGAPDHFVLFGSASNQAQLRELSLDDEVRSCLARHPSGTSEKSQLPALVRIGERLGLVRFVWLFAPQPNASEYLMIAGFGPESAELHPPQFEDDLEHFEMLARHLAALLGNAALVFSLQRERAELRSSLAELKQTQDHLRASSSPALGQLAAGVAHEVNNPLAVIVTNLEMSESDVGDSLALLPEVRGAELLEMISEARASAERIREVVRDLRTLAKGTSDERARVDLRRVLDFAANVTANAIRDRALLVKDIDNLPPVIANESRLQQVFVNLLLNAAQAIPEGHVEANQIRIVGRRRGAEAVIEIHDTGQGIPKPLLPQVFEPFFTNQLRGRGTGLALSVCDSIVSALGGSIEVESEVDHGSIFRVILPATESKVPTAPKRPTRPSPPRGRVLVVDDEPLVALSFRRMLSRHYAVDTEHHGHRVLERLASGERFDAILCDMMMPEMTGAQLYVEIQRVAPEQAESVIFITGGALTESTSAFLEQIANPVLEKPINLADIRRIIDALIARGQQPRA